MLLGRHIGYTLYVSSFILTQILLTGVTISFFFSRRLPLKEAQQEVFVPKGATVHKVQKLLSPALWGNTVEPKETKNQMTVSRVTLGMTLD